MKDDRPYLGVIKLTCPWHKAVEINALTLILILALYESQWAKETMNTIFGERKRLKANWSLIDKKYNLRDMIKIFEAFCDNLLNLFKCLIMIVTGNQDDQNHD